MADIINVTVTSGGTISADMTDATVVSTSVVSGGTVAASVIGGGKGEKGDTGAQGPAGPQGEPGVQGVQGIQGVKGDTGATGTISVGTTSNLAPKANATVSNSGTSTAAIFNFGIPQGAVWYTGPSTPSTTHNDGDLYLNTSNGYVYQQSSGSWGSPIANLTGPQGSAGNASGADTQVQFNDGGTFAGSAGLTYNKTTHALSASGNISGANLSGTNTGDQTTITGNAGSATKLQTTRTIGGVNFDGTTNINLPGVNQAGNQNTSGNAATATKLQTARNINGVAFDGSVDIATPTAALKPIQVAIPTTASTVAKVGTTSAGNYSPVTGDILQLNFSASNTASNPTLAIDGGSAIAIRNGGNAPSNIAVAGLTVLVWFDGAYFELFGSQRVTDTNTTYTSMTVAEGEAGSATTARTMQADYLSQIINFYVQNALTGMNSDIQYGYNS